VALFPLLLLLLCGMAMESEFDAVTTRRLRKLFAILDDDENGKLDVRSLCLLLTPNIGDSC